MSRFKMGLTNDPRGKHWAVYDSEYRNVTCARAWKEEDCKKLMDMHNSGEIKPDYWSKCIGSDAEKHLTPK